MGSAAIYISPLTQWLLGRTTIQNTFLTLGAGAFVLILLFSLLLNNPPEGYKPAGVAPAAGGPVRKVVISGRDRDWPEMLKTPQFYLLWLIYVLSAAAGLMIIANAALIAKDQAAWEAGFVGVMILAAFNTLGRVLAGFVSDRFGRTRTMILAFALQAVNMALFIRYDTQALIIFGTAFTGLCYGTIFTLMPAPTADFYGVRNLGVNYGLLFTGFGVAGVLGPILGGRIRDVSGSYTTSYTISAVLLLVAAVLACTTRAPRTTTAPAAL